MADELTGNRAALTGDHANHLVRVLRASVGQEFDIATANSVRRGRIVSIAQGRVEFDLGEEIPAAAAPNLTLILAVIKFDRMEWAIEKCTELGISRIIPAIARRTEIHLASAATKRVDRWRKIAMQAAEQSRRAAPPEIYDPMKLVEALKLPGTTRIALSESEDRTQLRDAIASYSGEGEILLAIGPEGGWTADELQLFKTSGWISTSLGSTILRAETAAIAAAAITISELG